MGVSIFKNTIIGNKIFKSNLKGFAKTNLNRIEKFIGKNDKIIDIGCGRGGLSYLLKNNDYNITSLDVENISLTKDIKPIIYDGKNIPFKENEFDIALIITVLHHTKNPIDIIKETKRVAKRIIIIEDIYNNSFQKYLTFMMDNIMNFEIFTNPHSNKNDKQWKKVFKELDLKLEYEKQEKVLKFFKQAIYVLDTK